MKQENSKETFRGAWAALVAACPEERIIEVARACVREAGKELLADRGWVGLYESRMLEQMTDMIPVRNEPPPGSPSRIWAVWVASWVDAAHWPGSVCWYALYQRLADIVEGVEA